MAASSLGRPAGLELEAYSSSFSAPLYSFPPLMEAGNFCPPDDAVLPGFAPELDVVLPPPLDDQYSLPLETFSGGGGPVTGGNNHDLDGMVMDMYGMSGSGFPLPATPPSYYYHCCGNHNNAGRKEELDAAARGHRRIGFRTRSAVEVMEDGFRWRKYGKKAVKSSPNLRNYYRCSAPGCGVKKRVERDRHDPAYVITTYHGVHNHPTPAAS